MLTLKFQDSTCTTNEKKCTTDLKKCTTILEKRAKIEAFSPKFCGTYFMTLLEFRTKVTTLF